MEKYDLNKDFPTQKEWNRWGQKGFYAPGSTEIYARAALLYSKFYDYEW